MCHPLQLSFGSNSGQSQVQETYAAASVLSSLLIAPIEKCEGPLTAVPKELFLEILGHSNIGSIGALSQTCRKFNDWLQEESSWTNLHVRHFGALKIPKGTSSREAYQKAHKLHSNFKNGVFNIDLISSPRSRESVYFPLFGIIDDKIITGGLGNSIWMYDFHTEKLLTTFDHLDPVFFFYVFNQELIYFNNNEDFIEVYDLNRGTLLWKFEVLPDFTAMIAFDGKLLTGYEDGSIIIWDLQKGERLQMLKAHSEPIDMLYYFNQTLVSYALNNELKIWNWKTKECISTACCKKPILSIVGIDQQLVLGFSDGGIQVLNKKNLAMESKIQSTEAVLCLTLAMIGGNCLLVAASKDMKIHFYDLKSGECVQTLHNPYSTRSIKFQSGKLICLNENMSITKFDFSADDLVIFDEIVEDIKTIEAVDERFSRMPRKARVEIYRNFQDLLNIDQEEKSQYSDETSLEKLWNSHPDLLSTKSDAIKAYIAQQKEIEKKGSL